MSYHNVLHETYRTGPCITSKNATGGGQTAIMDKLFRVLCVYLSWCCELLEDSVAALTDLPDSALALLNFLSKF